MQDGNLRFPSSLFDCAQSARITSPVVSSAMDPAPQRTGTSPPFPQRYRSMQAEPAFAMGIVILCYDVPRWAVSSVGLERLVYTQKVTGSNPVPPTTLSSTDIVNSPFSIFHFVAPPLHSLR